MEEETLHREADSAIVDIPKDVEAGYAVTENGKTESEDVRKGSSSVHQ